MIENISLSEKTKKIFKKIVSQRGESGTFMLYGRDKKQLLEVALTFAKSVNCLNLKNDFCGKCESCLRIEARTYGDLEIIKADNGLKIEMIRAMISKVGTSSYEGGNKIFIIENLEKIKNIGLNTLLKTIEEPPKGNYFILLTSSLNILPTVKSRSILLNIPRRSSKELDVSEKVYEFFNGDSGDILKFKEEMKNNESLLDSKVDIFKIGEVGKDFFKTRELSKKIEFYNCIRYWSKNYKWLEELDKIYFIEELANIFSENREEVVEFLSYCAFLKKEEDLDFVKKALIGKNKVRLPLNLKSLFLKIFI